MNRTKQTSSFASCYAAHLTTSNVTMSQQPVHIIRAGIGGLTLGRCLLKHGVPAVLYERMPLVSRHCYGITLHASSYMPLLDVLGLDEFTFRHQRAVDGALGSNGNIEPRSMVYPGKVNPTSFRANREKFEKFLREGLDIQWGHSLEKWNQRRRRWHCTFKMEKSLRPRVLLGLTDSTQILENPSLLTPCLECIR